MFLFGNGRSGLDLSCLKLDTDYFCEVHVGNGMFLFGINLSVHGNVLILFVHEMLLFGHYICTLETICVCLKMSCKWNNISQLLRMSKSGFVNCILKCSLC